MKIPTVITLISALCCGAAFMSAIAIAQSTMNPSPLVSPCAPDTAWMVNVREGFQSYGLLTPAPKNCSFTELYPQLKDIGSSSVTKSVITLSFSDSGLQIAYDFAQGVRPRADARFGAFSALNDDQAILYLRGLDGKPILRAYASAAGVCSTRSNNAGQLSVHDECSLSELHPLVAPRKPNCGVLFCWSGTLTVPYDDLRKNGLFSKTFYITPGMITSVGPLAPIFYSVRDFAALNDSPRVIIKTTSGTASQQYITAAPTVGLSGQPHRTGLGLFAPIESHVVASANFADAAGAVMSIRDKGLKSVLSAEPAKKLKCITCTTFQSDRLTSFFDSSITTSGVLGVSFSKLGVDNAPFAFSAVTYPVDSGVKLIDANTDQGLAFLAMQGTTDKDGRAADTALRYSFPFIKTAQPVTASVYHVVATRANGKRSTNTDLSISYTGLTAARAYSESAESSQVATFGALFRYGTQYMSRAQRLDIAAGIGFHPGYSQFTTLQKNLSQWAAAIGYRDLGANYSPLDQTFDPISGLHGFYGALQYTQPSAGANPLTLGFVSHRFLNAGNVEDNSLAITLSRTFKPSPFTLSADDIVAQLTMRQAARLLNFTPAIAGADKAYLPNGTYDATLQYSPGAYFQASIGFADGYAQNCATKSGVSSCFAYRTPSVTGSLFGVASNRIFLGASVQDQSNESFGATGSVWNSSQTSFAPQQTTLNHVVREIGFGLLLSRPSCGTVSITSENRGGDFDAFAASPPQPGFTTTYALDLSPSAIFPGALIAYAHGATESNVAGEFTMNSKFVARLIFGTPADAFIRQAKASCAHL